MCSSRLATMPTHAVFRSRKCRTPPAQLPDIEPLDQQLHDARLLRRQQLVLSFMPVVVSPATGYLFQRGPSTVIPFSAKQPSSFARCTGPKPTQIG
jgi:hypothetical protein